MLLSQFQMNRGAEENRPLTVSEAMQMAKHSLESVTVKLVGEVSEVNAKPGYKAVYFTVKDAGAALPCMMWLNRYRDAGVQLAVGMLVEMTGRFTLYAPKGRMNFDVFSVSLAGEGDLRRRVADLARKLEREGLMAPSRKRPIPHLPEHIGIVTSPRGAVVHDMLRTLRRRWPAARVSVAGVPVEGAIAPEAMVEGLRACVRAKCEVILLGRGGGSFEDLMPFNDEMLARAIAACPVPVVTGVGHEPDTTIADMVSDLRASTPTAAAEAVSPDVELLTREITTLGYKAGSALERRIERARLILEKLAAKRALADPNSLIATDLMTLDMLHDRLSRALPGNLEKDAMRIEALEGRLNETRTSLLRPFEHDVALRAGRLHDLSPLAILARGYAMARDDDGRVVKSVQMVQESDSLTVHVSDGTIDCTVKGTSPSR